MATDQRPGWDRAAELDRIRDAYQSFDASGRADGWASPNRGYRRLAAELRRSVVAEIERSLPRGGGMVLDLGCGSGDLLPDVAAVVPGIEYVGIDLRPDPVKRAEAAYSDGRFLVASADEIPMADATANVAVANILFSSIPSVRLAASVVAEIERVLAPGGWLVWLDLRYANPSNRFIRAMSRRRLERLFPGWTIDVRAAGLLPPVARRLGPTTAVLYPALASVPPLRSHLVGRLRPPAP